MADAESALKAYRDRRDFSRTREPRGRGKGARARAAKPRFVVQKHDARRLHYDFRLELDGVLKSWAVTRGPSDNPADKRLAVRTEDHPLDYGDFEGTIPADQYGGGTVMLWDTGWWEALHDPREGLEEGKLHFRLHGERMTGGWALVRMRPRKGERRENWLLIKEQDDRARDGGEPIHKRHGRSVATGRTMRQIAADPDSAEWDSRSSTGGDRSTGAAKRTKGGGGGKGTRMPGFVKPQLAMLVDEAPAGDDWLHEMKFDGYRLLVTIGGGKARCFTRNGLDWTDRFGAIAETLAAVECRNAVIDGEVVAAGEEAGSPFSALQRAVKEGGPTRYYAFDLLSLDGKDLRARPQVERKRALETLIAPVSGAHVRFSQHVTGHGGDVHAAVCRNGHEGIVSKRADAPYRSTRSRAWLKVKCTRRQEFVIGGLAPSDKRGRPFRSLLVGTYENGRLIYRGRVGTGFDEDDFARLSRRFARLRRKTSPFESVPKAAARDAHWLTPRLVGEVDFAELTDDGHIRHGSFQGLREDKEADKVTLETRRPGARRGAASQAKGRGKDAGSLAGRLEGDGKGSEDSVLGIRITHPERVLFAGQGVGKIDLARYYAIAAERMLAHCRDRPVSLVRCPQGPQKSCFFQKHASDGFPEAIRQVEIEESSGGRQDYMYVDSAAGLVAAVQMGTLEFHVWGSRIDRLERPDRMIFDLDPDEGLDFAVVKEAAGALRERLAQLGLHAWPMVTGGKGVHVVVPLERRSEWPSVKRFAKGLAVHLSEREPDRFVATMSKQKRKGKVFIDWLRNERGATAIAPYSTRSRKGGPVAVPVTWTELEDLAAANTFTIADMPERLDASDPWRDYGKVRQSLTRSMLAAVT